MDAEAEAYGVPVSTNSKASGVAWGPVGRALMTEDYFQDLNLMEFALLDFKPAWEW